MLERLKLEVYNANMELVKNNVVIYTWGNVSAIDREKGLVVIKPSGVNYNDMRPEDMVIVDLKTGKIVEGKLKPSSDTKTHLEIYKAFHEIKGITHTHSTNATAFAQAGVSIPALGTTHADYFFGDIPCTRGLTEDEVLKDYEYNTGKVIIETIKNLGYNPLDIPGILVQNHGPFTWGNSANDSVFNAVVLDKIAEIGLKTLSLNKKESIPEYILKKHYTRKHGPNAYYGQKGKK